MTAPRGIQQKLEDAPDFLTACRIAERGFRYTAGHLRGQCQREGIPHNTGFWLACADLCRTVACRYRQFLSVWKPDGAKARMLAWLAQEGLCDFYAALDDPGSQTFAELFY